MRSADMPERICFVGLDVHARKTAGAAVQLGSGEVFKAQIPGPPIEALDWMQTLPGPVRAVYEAGPTGFGLARAARAAGIEMMVCAPGAIPRQPGDRVKTDTRAALKLARLLAAGQLRPVVVPEPELEALRDLVRCREDLRGDLMPAGTGSANCCCDAACCIPDWAPHGPAGTPPGSARCTSQSRCFS
jgi:transposase